MAKLAENEFVIKDYWCQGCGLVGNTEFVCPICGSIDYRCIDLDLTNQSNKEHLMKLYREFTLYVHRENGQLALRDRSVGAVEVNNG